jgi:hypothetical protein
MATMALCEAEHEATYLGVCQSISRHIQSSLPSASVSKPGNRESDKFLIKHRRDARFRCFSPKVEIFRTFIHVLVCLNLVIIHSSRLYRPDRIPPFHIQVFSHFMPTNTHESDP